MAKKKRKSVREEMLTMLDNENLQSLMLQAVGEKARTGDLKTIEFILELIGESPGDKNKGPGPGVIKVELGPGVEELAK